MTFQVLLTDDASRGLEELYNYIESSSSRYPTRPCF